MWRRFLGLTAAGCLSLGAAGCASGPVDPNAPDNIVRDAGGAFGGGFDKHLAKQKRELRATEELLYRQQVRRAQLEEELSETEAELSVLEDSLEDLRYRLNELEARADRTVARTEAARRDKATLDARLARLRAEVRSFRIDPSAPLSEQRERLLRLRAERKLLLDEYSGL